jgi:filamentous hemagglutinin family protein
LAQSITLDGSLGSSGPIPTVNNVGNFRTIYGIRQSLGQTRGSNLFHSFNRFNLLNGEAAFFFSSSGIHNIFSRVTGGTPSEINGLIRTLNTTGTQRANVNFYLMNPAGIIFRPNARLNIGSSTRGSFVATTLDAIAFPNGSQFSAINPGNANSLLTVVGDPSGFVASQRQPGAIHSIGNTLQVATGQSLVLVGGDVLLDNSNLYVSYPTGGRIEIGSLKGAGIIGLTGNNSLMKTTIPKGIEQGDVLIRNRSEIGVDAANGGDLTIHARNIEVSGFSELLGGIAPRRGISGSQAGNIVLNASHAIRLIGGRIYNWVRNGSVGNAGNIIITARSLELSNKGSLIGDTSGRGNGGSINIHVTDGVVLNGLGSSGETLISSNASPSSVGNAGNIRIASGSLSLLNGAQINSDMYGRGQGGVIDVNVRNTVTIDGSDNGFQSGMSSTLGGLLRFSGGILPIIGSVSGKSGQISIKARNILLSNEGTLQTSTFGIGDAGTISLQAEDLISMKSGSQILSAISFEGNGKGGTINVKAGNLSISNGSSIQTIVRGAARSHGILLRSGRGEAGSININVQDSVVLDSEGNVEKFTGIASTLASNTFGKGGSIYLNSEALDLRNGAQIQVGVVSGRGDTGKRAFEKY